MGSRIRDGKSYPSRGLSGQNTCGSVDHWTMPGALPGLLPPLIRAHQLSEGTTQITRTLHKTTSHSITRQVCKQVPVNQYAHISAPQDGITSWTGSLCSSGPARVQPQARSAHLQSRRTQFLCSLCRCRAGSPIAPWPASAPEHGWVLF